MENLARHDNCSPDEKKYCDDVCRRELEKAGIAVSDYSFNPGGEVPTTIRGFLGFWGFRRAWTYWVADGPGLPVEVAEKLHAEFGSEVRVDGHCGCPSPRDHYKGFGVPLYHIDTQAGLNAFAEALRSVYDPDKDPEATPRTGGKHRG